MFLSCCFTQEKQHSLLQGKLDEALQSMLKEGGPYTSVQEIRTAVKNKLKLFEEAKGAYPLYVP